MIRASSLAAAALAVHCILHAALPSSAAASGTSGFLSIEADEPPAELRDGSALLLEASRHMAQVAAAVSPSVVHILSEHEARTGTIEETGSGVLMTSPMTQGTFVLTNRHVIVDAQLKKIQIHLHDGRVVYPLGKLEDPATDVAVLQIEARDLQPGRWGDSDNLDIGHIVMAMGSPFGLSESVTMGIISAKGRRSLELDSRREVINQDFLQTDAAINPGNSGGPLIDLQGRVVGINTAIASQGGGNEGIGFSIPINLVRYVVDQLLEHGRVQRGFLGVKLDDKFDDAAAHRYNLDRRKGARVVEVYANTPASTAGIKVNDLILDFNGMAIEDENHLIHLVSLTELNRPVRVIVLREGQQLTLQVTLIERPPRDQAELTPPPAANPAGTRFEHAGLSLHRLDTGLALQLGFPADDSGLLVMQVSECGDSDGLALYDVIEAVGRTEVGMPADFDAAVAGCSGPVLLRVRRQVDGETVTRLIVWER